MRVLIAAILLGGCYRPSIEDCQFKCAADSTCPDGTSCTGGFCRAAATGSCAADTIDAATDFCATAPALPVGCTTKFAIDGGCAVSCRTTQVAWTAASAVCSTASWHLATLDTQAKLSEVPTPNDKYWVGARRTGGSEIQWVSTGMTVTPALWLNGSPNGGEDCAYLDQQQAKLLNNTQCTDSQHFLCSVP